MSTVPNPAHDRVYPLPAPADDRRFTLGLVFDVAAVLTDHGFPPITSGGDLVALQQVLYGFLYAAPTVAEAAQQLDQVTGVPVCEHGDDADACQLRHDGGTLPGCSRECANSGSNDHLNGCLRGVAIEAHLDAIRHAIRAAAESPAGELVEQTARRWGYAPRVEAAR